jgi:hypothetical protein
MVLVTMPTGLVGFELALWLATGSALLGLLIDA